MPDESSPAKLPLPVRFLLVVVGGTLYVGLAILGWGGFVPFFSHPPLVALAVVTALLIIVSFFAGGNLNTGVREDRGNRWVLKAFGIIGLLAGFLPAYTDRIGFWTLDGATLRWIGVALYAIGGVIRIWPVFVLKNRFSGLVAIQPGHTLVTTGIYGIIRHPSYLGMILNALGWGLAFRSGVGVLLTVLIIIPLIARIHAEERLLLSEFGDDYEAYRARTFRLIPFVY